MLIYFTNMKKIIKLSESELIEIVKKIINEQRSDYSIDRQSNAIMNAASIRSNDDYKQVNQVITQAEKPQIKVQYTCVKPELSHATQFAISQKLNPFFVKYGLGILGRESDFGSVTKSNLLPTQYVFKGGFEYIMNKMSEIIPGFKSLLQWGAKKVFRKNNWVPSMGIAQMTPDIAKQYNISLEELMTMSGSLVGATRYLIDLYNITSKTFDTNQPSKIIFNKQLINNPSSSGNAALDAAIISYNIAVEKIIKTFCKTNNSEYMAPCNSPNGIYQPFPKDKPNFKLKVYPNQVIKNYIPTMTTKTMGNQYISTTGYLKEVVGYVKKFGCIK